MPDFKQLFDLIPGHRVALTPELKVLAVSNDYLASTMASRQEVVGKSLFDVFGDDRHDGPEKHDVQQLLREALETGHPGRVSTQSLEQPSNNGKTHEASQRSWSLTAVPFLDSLGSVEFVFFGFEEEASQVPNRMGQRTPLAVVEETPTRTTKMHEEIMIRSHEIRRINLDLAATVEALRHSDEEARALTQDLYATNLELLNAKEVAESANAAKSQFLSRMSHELRTPLNSVIGYSQLIELRNNDPEVLESTRSIMRAGKHLLRLINEVLDLSNIESDRISMQFEPVSVSDVVNYALDLLAPISRKAGITASFHPSEHESLFVKADRQRLLQTLINLLNNAIKYNDSGGSVTVSSSLEPENRVRIEIKDSGHGISEANQALLFQPFKRFGDSAVEGTGLGLALSRRLANLMGGTLNLLSSNGCGSTFVLDLERTEYGEPLQSMPVLSVDTRPSGSSATRTALYIEDNVYNMRLIELAFKQLKDVRLVPAVLGLIGLELAREDPPDLILLDLHLPDVSGESVLLRLKADPRTASIPVVVLSADATVVQIERLKSLGAIDYLTKPVDLPLLLGTIRSLLPESPAH